METVNLRIIATVYRDGKVYGRIADRDYKKVCDKYVEAQSRFAKLVNPHYEYWNLIFDKNYPDYQYPVNYGDPKDSYVIYISDLQRLYGTNIMNFDGGPFKGWFYDIGDECQLIFRKFGETDMYIDFDLEPVER